jgi:two-component system, OmpR family, sensor histidine kinase KdpD
VLSGGAVMTAVVEQGRTRHIGRIATSLTMVGAVTALYFLVVPVNPTTVALTYVVVVLLIATRWGIAEATVASIVAVACFNFFFLPPFLTWTIADAQNWVAFVVFMLTAVIVSQLSGRSRQRQIESLARQRDLERLYALSRALLLSEHTSSVPSLIAERIAEAFDLSAVALYDRHTGRIVFGGAADLPGIEGTLREVSRQAVSKRDPSGITITAVQLGGTPIGSLALKDAAFSDTVLQSIVNLTAIALERARGQEAAARAEAARQSAELRATVLDAVAHDFKTPLTSMKAASTDLLTSRTIGPRDRELAAILDEELDRFQTQVTDAIHMLRIDAGDFVMHLGRHNLSDLVDATLRRFERQFDGHDLVKRVPGHLTVDADRELLALALRQLFDNALKYSPPTSRIEIDAHSNGAAEITVSNSDSTIPEPEQARVVERFYRGGRARSISGTGMGLAIVQQIAQAHGGTLTLSSTPETGTAFTLTLPRGDSTR